MRITGTGIGQGVATGRVARMPEPLATPSDAQSTIGADAEKARSVESLARVARALEERGATAGGTARDVLEAQAMMAEDPTLADSIDELLGWNPQRDVAKPYPAKGAGENPQGPA